MSGYYIPHPPGPSPADQVETIWAMAQASLYTNNRQIIIPVSLAEKIGAWGINELRGRLSNVLDQAPTIAYKNTRTQTLCICRVSDYDGSSPASSPYETPRQLSPSPVSTPSSTDAPSPAMSEDKKSKVPRPPNAFILYRKHHHPLLKENNPDMHNNEISIILGKQWNAEAEDVKNEYRAHAEKIKKKHAIDNPGYQYAPRKPSEKRRRMTTRKVSQMRATDSEEYHDRNKTATTPVASAAHAIGVSRANDPGHLSRLREDAPEVSVNLPLPQRAMQQQFDINHRIARQQALLSFDQELQQTHLVTTSTVSNRNDQDFMNSLIDWEGLRRDADLVFGVSTEEGQDLAAVETGDQEEGPLSDEDFEAELDRLTRMI